MERCMTFWIFLISNLIFSVCFHNFSRIGFQNSTGIVTSEHLNSAEYLSENSETVISMKLRRSEIDKQAKVFHGILQLSLFNLASLKSGSSQWKIVQ